MPHQRNQYNQDNSRSICESHQAKAQIRIKFVCISLAHRKEESCCSC